ncbi:MAG: FliH/SctL family protein [Planctomycetota bacterium]|nr:FliH/SctL family protein [Planctomycetota bacterium]
MPSAESSRLLKAGAARDLGHKVAFNFEDLKEKGESYVVQVREQGRKILDEATEEAERLRVDAQKIGYMKGREQAFAEIEIEVHRRASELAQTEIDRRWQNTLPALENLVKGVAREKENWIAHWERTAVKLSVAIAERIIRRTIDADGEVSLEMIRETLQLASGQPEITVNIHPADIEGLGNEIEQIQRLISPVGPIHFIPDAKCSRGGCQIRTINGSIDARLETQLNRILDELIPEETESPLPRPNSHDKT